MAREDLLKHRDPASHNGVVCGFIPLRVLIDAQQDYFKGYSRGSSMFG